MNHVNSDLLRFVDDAEATEVQYAPYEVRSQLINDALVPIRVATRDGFKFIVPPRHNNDAKLAEFKIQIAIGISSDVQNQLLRMFNNELNCDRQDLIRKAMTVWATWNRMRPKPLRVEHVISQKLLAANGGTLYLKELDYAVSTNLEDESFCHPYSVESGLKNMASTWEDSPDDQYVFNICIVDNAEKIGPRWIKDAMGVCKIEPMKSDKSDGFYIVRTSSATTGLQKGTLTPEYHESETTLAGVKLYTSWAEAFNSDSANQAELAANELKNKLLISENALARTKLEVETLQLNAQQTRDKHEHERTKLQHDKDVLIAESRALKLKMDRDQEKAERELDKLRSDYHYARSQHEDAMERLRAEREKVREQDRADAASHTRKVLVDILKLVATLISGFFSVLVFAQKTKKA